MKKKSKILIFLILLILIVAVVINIGKALIPSYEEMYKGSWGFSFPSNLKYAEIYEKDTGSSFHGDGYRYHVYTYEVEDGIAEMVEWHNTEGHTKYFPSYYEAVENWLTEIKAEKEQYPIYENANYYYQWREDNSELILIWNSQEKKIYILESFMQIRLCIAITYVPAIIFAMVVTILVHTIYHPFKIKRDDENEKKNTELLVNNLVQIRKLSVKAKKTLKRGKRIEPYR